MEDKLKEIQANVRLGKYKQSINDLEILINDHANDDFISKAYDLLGDYRNYLGEHVRAVQAWENSINILESKIGGIDQLDNEEIVDWINTSIKLARSFLQQGKDGPGVSHTQRSVSIIPSKLDDNEKAEWIDKQFQNSLKHYRQSIEKIPEHLSETKMKIQTEFASVLFSTENFDEAVQIYEEGFHNYGKVEWIYNAGMCLWKQGKKDLAYKRFEQAIGTDPTFSKAYKMAAEYFDEQNDKEKAEEYRRKCRFYSWIPDFCQNIELNEENLSILDEINSNQGVNCIQTKLANDFSRRSTEFLASICYRHYHGQMDDEAFDQLELRGIQSHDDEKDFIRSILMYLIENCSSICTIKGAANALAAIKHPNIFTVLTKLLYRDTNYHYPMHIPSILAKLGDPRAISVLIEMIENPVKCQNNDSDSSDEEIFSSIQISRLIKQSCLALATFYHQDEKVKEFLINGMKNERIHQSCLAALYISTLEEQYLDQIRQILNECDTLDGPVLHFLYQHREKSEKIDEILTLNKTILNNKQKSKKK